MSATRTSPARPAAGGTGLLQVAGPRWPMVLVLCATLGLHNGSRIGPASLVDELRLRYGVDYGGVGNVIGGYTLTYGFAQLASGFLTDRFGCRRVLFVGLGVMTLGSGVFALANDYTMALVGRWLMGIAGGFLYTPSIMYTLAAFNRGSRGRAMAFAQSGTGAGQVLSITVLPLLYLVLGLTGAFMAYPLLAIGLAVAMWFLLPPMAPERRGAFRGLGELARNRDFWLLLVGYAFIGMVAQSSVLSWVPTYLRSLYGWSAVDAGMAGGVVAAGLLIFPAPIGVLTDRWQRRRMTMLLGCTMGLAGWLILLWTTNPYVAVAAAVLVSASMAATLPVQALYASEQFSVVGAGTAVGLANTGGQIGQSLAAPFYGAMLDLGVGFGLVWGTSILFGLLRLGAVLLMREHHTPASAQVPAPAPKREAAPA